ncbi:spinster family MFS transporter [Thermosporothrix hazakensis]|jgi:MFS family permease|nr:MFS transporter [Thermosporothrix hazakensis]
MMEDTAPVPRKGEGRRPLVASASYVFWVMFCISFLNYLDRYVLSGAGNVMAKELKFDLGQLGLIGSAFLIVYTLCSMPLGMLGDRLKRKNVVATCVAIWSCATALTALANNFLSLFLFRMLLGVGEAGYFPAGTALLSDYFSRSRRSRIMSFWSIGQYVGVLGGYALGGYLATLYFGSWRLAFLLTGIPGLLLALLIWLAREPRRNQADEEEQQQRGAVSEPVELTNAPRGTILQQCLSLLKIKTMITLTVMQIFAYFVLGIAAYYLPVFLQQKDTFDLSSDRAGLYSGGVIVIASLIGTLTGGYLSDLLNRRHPGARVLVCGLGFLLCAPVFATAILTRDMTLFTLFFVLTAILLTLYTGPSTAAIQDVVPSYLRSSAVAVSMLVAHLLGDAFAPPLVGMLATSFDPTHGTHFQANMAGNELALAFLYTCVPALVLAGLVGIFGARWMKDDVAAAEQADREARIVPAS